MKKFALSLSCLVLLTTVVFAKNACSDNELKWLKNERYKLVFRLSSGQDVFLNTAQTKIDKENKIIEVWTVSLASEDEQFDAIDSYGDSYNNYGFLQKVWLINYSTQEFQIKEYIDKSCDRQMITMGRIEKWKPLLPDTLPNTLMKRIIKEYNLQ